MDRQIQIGAVVVLMIHYPVFCYIHNLLLRLDRDRRFIAAPPFYPDALFFFYIEDSKYRNRDLHRIRCVQIQNLIHKIHVGTAAVNPGSTSFYHATLQPFCADFLPDILLQFFCTDKWIQISLFRIFFCPHTASRPDNLSVLPSPQTSIKRPVPQTGKEEPQRLLPQSYFLQKRR